MRRGIVVLLALILASAAGWLWMNRDDTHRLRGDGHASHGEIGAEDRDALRDVLREEAGP